MKHFPSIVVIACFIYNWLAANAYHPLAAMLANKKQSLRKTVSGILGADSLKGYFSKHLSKLDMFTVAGNNGLTNTKGTSSSSNLWEKLFSKTATTAAVSKSQGESTSSDSSTALYRLIKQQSAEIDRPRKLEGYVYTDVAGYMEYDPKTAALNAYKRNARQSLKRHAEGSGWFHL